jgi:hypothetical protein
MVTHTPSSVLQAVLQGMRGVLESQEEDAEACVRLPVFYLLVWQEYLALALRMLETPE